MVPAAVRPLVDASAAPPAVNIALERLAETHPDLADRLEASPALGAALVAVLGASRSLTTLLVAEPDALDVLASLDTKRAAPSGDEDALVHWKRLELLRIAARDLLGIDQLEQVGASLTELAVDVLQEACTLAGAHGLAVVAMGKCGGNELNYASDVDLLFVGGDDRAAGHVLDVARRCFRIDVDLRPEGRNGPLTRTLESYQAYWRRWALPWEFQALLKANPIAGDLAVGRAFATAAAQHIWDRPFSADDLRSLRELKARSEAVIRQKGLAARELKRGYGGIRDIEFAVQLLQLVHGRHDAALRSPNTLNALGELTAGGFVDPADAAALEGAYRFLRTVEHRMQLVDEQQVYAVPADDEARRRLARVLGYKDGATDALSRLDGELRRHQATVRSIHERLYFRPLLEAFLGTDGRMDARAAEARLAAFGFVDMERARAAVKELTRGLTRSSRLMQQLLPLLLGWLADSPDPDLGLFGLRTLADGPQRTTALVNAFRDSTEAARRLAILAGTSRLFADRLRQNPDLIAALGDDRALVPRQRDELDEVVRESVSWRDDVDARAAGLQRVVRRERLRLAAGDVLGLTPVADVGQGLTYLAESVLEQALATVNPPVPFSIIAMGRFGGAELSYASDLDVLLVYDAPAGDVEAAERAAENLRRLVQGETPAQRVYALDTDLRPEGKQGPLARSIEAYGTYYDRWVSPWELQALTRARPVAGDVALGARFMELVGEHVWSAPPGADAVREIRRLKARIERERIPVGEDAQFHLKLGRGSLSDIEWTVQLLQLREQRREPGTMAAIAALHEAGAITAVDAAALADAYRFCEHTRNRLYLVQAGPGDALPAQQDQLDRLARSLGTDGSSLREQYRRVTRRARSVFERLFYDAA